MIDTKKTIYSWAFYDWANSAFATTVMAGFFPIFFKSYWANPNNLTESTFYLGMANSIASILVAAFAPFLGAIADKGTAKKKFLFTFAFLGVIMSGSLWMVGYGMWQLAILFYIAATVGFSGGNIFYDSLITGVATEKKVDFASSLGFSLGYLGGGILFAVNVIMYLKPELFGFIGKDAAELARIINSTEIEIAFADVQTAVAGLGTKYAEIKTAFASMAGTEEVLLKKLTGLLSGAEAAAIKASFLSVAVWWAVFSIPIFLFVKEPYNENAIPFGVAIKQGWKQLISTFKEIRHLKVVGIFLLAYWFYIDGVDTIVRMAVDYGMSIGFEQSILITALLITQFVAFPATLVYILLADKIGLKNSLLVAILAYGIITVLGYFMNQEWHFFALAIGIGLFQGGIQAISRSLYTRLIPKHKSAEFFGFYNMLGKFAAVIGPALMGTVTLITGSNRLGILSILVLFIAGGYLLMKVDIEEGKRNVAEYLEKS
ncbi:MAG: MFS transporter [Candidatus Marinimicrobia bacterium]|nr:MFS transporter [Candidatus Neomarinimicrobiota bacterium]